MIVFPDIQSKLRDDAWPEVTKSVWSEERTAIREFMKAEWKKSVRTEEINKSSWGYSPSQAAKEEANDILKVLKQLISSCILCVF